MAVPASAATRLVALRSECFPHAYAPHARCSRSEPPAGAALEDFEGVAAELDFGGDRPKGKEQAGAVVRKRIRYVRLARMCHAVELKPVV